MARRPKRRSGAERITEESLFLPSELVRYLEDPSRPLDETLYAALDKVVEDERVRASLWLLAVVRRRTHRLIEVFEQMDEASASLAKDVASGRMAANDKVGFLKALQDESEKISRFVEDMSSREMMQVMLTSIEERGPGGIQRLTRQAEAKLPNSFLRLSPAKRERVRRYLVEMAKGGDDGEAGQAESGG